MRRSLRPVAVLVSASALAGCWVPVERGRQMEARILRLEGRAAEQQGTLDEQREVIRDRIAKVDEKIREVQAKIDELNRAARRSGADLGVQLTRLADDFAKLRGELEVAQHRLGELEKSVADTEARVEARFAAIRGTGALDEYEARQKVAALPKQDDRAAFLALAQREEKGGDKGVARELYEQYARRWPTDARAADARLRAGRILFDQKRWREALLSYGKLAEELPKSDEAPEAMLGAAESMLALDMKDDAKAVLEQLVQKYPKTPAATRAKKRHDELWPPPPPPKRPARKRR